MVRSVPELPDDLRVRLDEILDGALETDTAVREHHSRGEGWDTPVLPAAVVYPTSTEQVAAVLACCSEALVPVVPFGAGSSLEGHVVPLRGGVSLDLSRMNRILEVNDLDLDCRVETGVTRLQLEQHLRFRGLFFPVDPGADATLGGMVATGASGTTTVRYGAMRHNVLGLTVALADGSIIHTGGRARKSSVGYDLTRLFIGSEGTLGVVTEVQLRLYGIPEAISAAVCQFPAIGPAVDTVTEAIQLGIPLARSELLDALMMRATIDFAGLDELEPAPTLFFEFHGTETAVAEQAEQVGELARANGGSNFRWATRPEDRSRLWKARHDAHYAAQTLAPGRRSIVTDVCVPVSRLTECIVETQRDIQDSGVIGPLVGHIGDGNFHSEIFCDPEDANDVERARALVSRMVERALAMGGTASGEHGVGSGKVGYLEREHGDAVGVMRALKRTLDPRGILNPGKVLPPDPS